MNRRLTQVALAAAAALTLSLATPVAANADQSAAFASGASSATAPRPSTVSPSLTLSKFTVRHGVITGQGANPVAASFALGDTWASDLRADVYVDKKYKGQVPLRYANQFSYTGRWGAGSVRLGPIRYKDQTGAEQVDPQYSNYFRIRQGVKWSNSPISKRGAKITFKLRGFKTFNGSSWVSVQRAKLQVKKGKKWTNLRTVKLNKSGSAVVRVKHKKKRNYRVHIPTTTRIQGTVSRATRI